MIQALYLIALAFLLPASAQAKCFECYTQGIEYNWSGFGTSERRAYRESRRLCKENDKRGSTCAPAGCRPSKVGCEAESPRRPDFKYCDFHPTAPSCESGGYWCRAHPSEPACRDQGYCDFHPTDPACN